MTVRTHIAYVAFLALAGCATKRLPPGTPPPEYEERPVAPWPSAPAAPEPSPPVPSDPIAPAGPDAGLQAGDAAAPFPEAGVD